jgi:5-methylcytosine-specific restriction endonuclease McrA
VWELPLQRRAGSSGRPAHRRPAIRFSDAPRGTCRWCGEPIRYPSGPKQGDLDRRRRWHPACVDAYLASDPREQRRLARKRDRGVCRACGLDTRRLDRETRGRERAKRLRALGFHPRRSLWELDHVLPLVEGGGHDLANLQTLCVPCHRRKSALESRERARSLAGEGRLEGELDELLHRADVANARVAAFLAGGR